MSRGRYVLRTARKSRQCTECGTYIEAGDRYLDGSCPPEHEANSSRRWWLIRACLPCCDRYGLHNTATRTQMTRWSDLAERHHATGAR
jgi:hypothetical protein